jgi:phage terminase large subunit
MTSTKKQRAANLRGPSADERTSMLFDVTEALEDRLGELTSIRWPSSKYRADPVAFAHEILGVEPWSKQVEILEAVRDHMRVAIKSGHKIGKSNSAAIVALWFYCAFPNARVVMSSTTSRQVDQILWRELSMMHARAGKCVACKKADPNNLIPVPCPHSARVDGEPKKLARTGLKSNFREIVGFTAREAEAVAGISGANLIYLIDEASGVPQEIFDAIEGNRAGGARIVLFSNPTQTTGEFFEAFNSKARFYHGITVSSEDTPNCTGIGDPIPGLAGPEWIAEKKEEWGEDSPLYIVRVKGGFALKEDGKIFSTHALMESERRWHEFVDEDGEPLTGMQLGRLFIGVDPAGESGTGDDSCFVARRGKKMLSIGEFRGLDDEGHLARIVMMIRDLSVERDQKPVVVIDREGSIGAKLYGRTMAFLEAFPSDEARPFVLVAVRASDRSPRRPNVYDTMRDALAGNLEGWIRDGGAILENAKLSKEMHELEWRSQVNGRIKVTPKKEIKQKLKRSPDRYDALALATWEPLDLRMSDASDAVKSATAAERKTARVVEFEAETTFDPYAASDAFR